GVSFAGGSSLVVFHGTKQPAEAWALVEFLSRPEQQVRFWRLTGDLPARREAWADSGLAADERTRAFGDQLQRTVPCPMVPEWEEIATRVYEQADRAIRGVVPADTALSDLDRIVDRLLEKRRWLATRRAAARFVGRANYSHALGNADFWNSLRVTLVYALVGAPLSVAVSLAAALLVDARTTRWKPFFRAVYFAPVVTTLVAVAIVWRYL